MSLCKGQKSILSNLLSSLSLQWYVAFIMANLSVRYSENAIDEIGNCDV